MYRLLVVLVLLGGLGSTSVADSIAMSVPARKPGVPDVPELESFVFVADQYRSGNPPRGLAPAKVGAYLAGMIDKTTPLRAVEYAATAALAYDASEVVAPFRKLLDKQEGTAEDVRRSIVFARLVSGLGTDTDAAAAATYFVYLCGRADSQQELTDLVELYAALGTTVDPKPLRDRIAARIATLAPKVKSDYQARLESLKLQESVTSTLEAVKLAKTEQATILAATDRAARLRATIELYIGITGTAWDLRPWAAARLRRETWAEQPSEFLARVDKPAHKAGVIKALRASLVPMTVKRSVEERTFMNVRILKAIEFFGGKLSAAETKLLAAKRNSQSDWLAKP